MTRERRSKYFCIAFHGEVSDETHAAVAESFLRYTPDVTLRGFRQDGVRRAIFLEVGRCLALYSETSLERRLLRILREFGISAERATLARSDWMVRAWLLAVYRSIGAEEDALISRLPISAIEDVIDPLGGRVAMHSGGSDRAKVRAMIEVLFLLGIRTLGGLRRLPPDSAVSRFGELYEVALRNLEDGEGVREAWERFRPLDRMKERVEIDPAAPLFDLEPVLFETKSVLDRLLRRAAGRGNAIVKMEIRLECEPRRNIREKWSELRIDFSFPQVSSLLILRTLREKLAFEFGRKPLDSPIIAIELEATELAPRRSAQPNFFDTEEARLESEREAWRDLVTELSTKLRSGKELFQSELVPSWRPERSWRRVLKNPEKIESIALPIPERPLRILSPPEELRRLGRFLFWRGERFRILALERAERLSGEWWESEGGFARNYYRVRANRDEVEETHFWIYRESLEEGRKGAIFLHGVF